jgi:hypothetical protein
VLAQQLIEGALISALRGFDQPEVFGIGRDGATLPGRHSGTVNA